MRHIQPAMSVTNCNWNATATDPGLTGWTVVPGRKRLLRRSSPALPDLVDDEQVLSPTNRQGPSPVATSVLWLRAVA